MVGRGGNEQAKAISRLSSILLLGAVFVLVLVSLRLVNLQSTVALLIFNILFFSITFQFDGSLNRKLFLLAVGNLTGLCWSYLFANLAAAATFLFGKVFLYFYTFFFPFLSSIWIVSFWALSLTVLHRRGARREGPS